MITEFPLAAHYGRLRQNIQTQLFEVAFSTCMQMSKNQPGHWSARCSLVSWVSPCRQSQKRSFACLPLLVGVAGFEPATLRLSSACSNQLSYTPGFASPVLPLEASPLVEVRGLEPLTYSLQSYRSTN